MENNHQHHGGHKPSHEGHAHQGSHGSPATKSQNSNTLIAVIAIAVVLVIVAVANFGDGNFSSAKKLSPEEAKNLAEDYINSELVSGATATVSEVTDYNKTLYKLTVMLEGDSIESFMSKDGKMFFPQGMDTSVSLASQGVDGAPSTASAPVIPADLPKSEKPVVELFVMSHCPFGLQMQKGILPVVAALGDKMDFQPKFVNYAMHDKIEIDEQARQYCIDKEQPEKLVGYLNCFVKAGDSAACGTQAGLDEGKISSCVSKADSDYKLTANYNDRTTYNGQFPPFSIHDADNKKYGVQGSPTLVINGKEVNTGRDSQSLMATICAAFNNQPSECSEAMPAGTPSPGFGEGTAASNANSAACGVPM